MFEFPFIFAFCASELPGCLDCWWIPDRSLWTGQLWPFRLWSSFIFPRWSGNSNEQCISIATALFPWGIRAIPCTEFILHSFIRSLSRVPRSSSVLKFQTMPFLWVFLTDLGSLFCELTGSSQGPQFWLFLLGKGQWALSDWLGDDAEFENATLPSSYNYRWVWCAWAAWYFQISQVVWTLYFKLSIRINMIRNIDKSINANWLKKCPPLSEIKYFCSCHSESPEKLIFRHGKYQAQ